MGESGTAMQLTGEVTSGSAIGPSRDFVSLYMMRATLEADIQATTVSLNSLKSRQAASAASS